MAKHMANLTYLLGIALCAFCGASYSAQDTAQAATMKKEAQTAPVPASPDTAKKSAVNTSAAVPAPAQTPPAKTTQTLQKKKTAGEDILDEEDLILPEKGVDLPAKKTGSEGQAKAAEPTQEKGAARPTGDTSRLAADSSAANAASASPQPAPAANAASAPAVNPPAEKSSTKAVTIEDARPINFARNLKEYRSPKLAMLLSLVVPGLGQAYVGKPVNYIKAGVFVAAEAAIIGISAYYNNKGNVKYTQAKNYANTYYSYDSMIVYYTQLYNFLNKDPSQNLPESLAYGKLNEIYGDTLGLPSSTFSKYYNNNHPTQDYYRTIEDKMYVHGWKGCEPSLEDIKAVASGDTINNPAYRNLYQRASDTSGNYLVNLVDRTTGKSVPGSDNELQYGYSPYQREYKSMMNESNRLYKIGTNVLFVILLNHVLSAVDALLSAKSYNDWLLGRQTFWDNISVQPATAFSGPYLSPGLTMRVRF